MSSILWGCTKDLYANSLMLLDIGLPLVLCLMKPSFWLARCQHQTGYYTYSIWCLHKTPALSFSVYNAGTTHIPDMGEENPGYEDFVKESRKKWAEFERFQTLVLDSLEQLGSRRCNRQSDQHKSEEDTKDGSQHGGITAPDSHHATSGAPGPGKLLTFPATDDVQAEYKAIAEVVQKVQLPADCIINKSAQGVTKEVRTAHTILTQSAKYTETALKLLIVAFDNAPADEAQLAKLFTVHYAQIKFLQDELAGLIVQGQFDQNTSRLFRSLQKNTSVFTSDALENLKSAAAISAVSANQNTPRRSPRGGYRGRGRGGRGGYFTHQSQSHDDYFAHATANRHFGQRGRYNNNFNSQGNGDNDS